MTGDFTSKFGYFFIQQPDNRYYKPPSLRLCCAVEYAHSRGLIHRDIKPANIFCTITNSSIQVKVGDFGVSKILSSRNQLAETVSGTLLYQAPEVLTTKYDSSVDVYSVGVVFMQVLAGCPTDQYTKIVQDIVDRIAQKVEVKSVTESLALALLSGVLPQVIVSLVTNERDREVVSKMVCYKETRLSSDQLVRHPVIQKWAQQIK